MCVNAYASKYLVGVFRHGVRLEDGRAERRLQALQNRGGEGGGAGADETEFGGVGPKYLCVFGGVSGGIRSG